MRRVRPTPPNRKRGSDRRTRANMKQQHIQFVTAIIDSYVPTILEEMENRLLNEFLDLTVSKTAFYTHSSALYIELQEITKIPTKQSSEKIILKRKEVVLAWMFDRKIWILRKIAFS